MESIDLQNFFNSINISQKLNRGIVGVDFVEALVKELSIEIDIDFLLVGQVDSVDNRLIKVDFVSSHGTPLEAFAYELKGTPCENVMGSERVCLYPCRVTEEFPDDQLLIDMGIQGYAGAPILTPEGELLGIVAALKKTPLENTNLLVLILEFYANRIGLEFSRVLTEQKLKNINKELEQKVLEKTKMIQKSHEALLEQNKLASLGRVISGIAHEIRNPLNFIINSQPIIKSSINSINTELNISDRDIYEKVFRHSKMAENGFDIIEKHSLRIQEIMNKMLDQSKAKLLELTSYNLKKLITDSYQFAYHASSFVKKGIPLEYKIDVPKDYTVKLTNDVQSVFLNLFDNAFSSLETKHSHHKSLAKLNVSTYMKDNDLIIEIYDNGVGISESARAKIFEPFFSTKPTSQGTGLGLSLVKNIVDQNKGLIEVSSKQGDHTRFTVKFNKDRVLDEA